MAVELTIKQACEHPASFLYVWADNRFLNEINPQYARIIRVKKANQMKVLMLSADKYFNGDWSKVSEYYSAIKKAFEDMYGMSPYNALIVLARGGEVAGKNWAEGVYGIGALPTSVFAGVTANGGANVSVDKTTGHIFYGGKDITDESRTVYNNIRGKVIPYQLFGTDDFGYTYMSQYNKTLKKYYAQIWTDDSGQSHSASTGKVTTASDGASIWGNITIDWTWIQNVLNWLLSLFGISPIPALGGETVTKETLTTENTLPNQQADGFVQKAGMSEAAAIALLLVAGGTLMAGGIKTKKNQ